MSVGKKIKSVFVLRHFVVSMITRKCLQLYCVRKKIYVSIKIESVECACIGELS